MRKLVHPKLTAGRIRDGAYASDDSWDLCGAFFVQGPCGAELKILSSNADFPEAHGWEHVSVSCKNRCPNWPEMSFVKDLFWRGDETVVQFHPPESEYVNNHPYCLHLWRDTNSEHKLPPSILVGVKALGTLDSVSALHLEGATCAP